nr:zinc finger and SCAN domain-containing protein 32-like [Caretta caretta]
MHRPGIQEKACKLLNFISCLASEASSPAQVTMQSSSSQETMQSQNHQRAPAWTQREVWDLIAIWGDKSMLAELHLKRQNAKIFEKISNVMKDRGYNRDLQQCHMKIKVLRQAYQKNREANGCSGSEPQTCHFYDELHAILGSAATTTPTLCFDSVQGVVDNMEAGFGGEEDEEEEEVVDSSQQGSGETSFPNIQDLFLTLDLEPIPPEPTQGGLPDPEGREGGEGTSAGYVSPSQRLAKIRRRKKCTCDEMFSDLMLSCPH